MKFGVMVGQHGFSYHDIKEVCAACEQMGYTHFWLVDHFMPYNQSVDTRAPMLECWSTLSALSVEFKKIRLGPLVTCASYRNPSLLSKICATVDQISQGRLELGIGAGWFKEEFERFGFPFDEFDVRVKKLEEAVQIIKAMWSKEEATFEGLFYRVKNALCYPKPVQRFPKIWIGAEKNKMLKVAAKLADNWNFASDINRYTLEEYAKKVEIFEKHCKELGKNPASIEKSVLTKLFIAESAESLRSKASKMGIKIDSHPALTGTPDECTKTLEAYEDLGVSHFVFAIEHKRSLSELELFSKLVMPSF